MARMRTDPGQSWARLFAQIAGIVFLILGLIGFFAPLFLGFHLTDFHNWVHILTGIVLLIVGFVPNVSAMTTAWVVGAFGTVYALLGVVGFLAGGIPGIPILGIVDNLYHLVVGLLGIWAAVASAPTRAVARRPVT